MKEHVIPRSVCGPPPSTSSENWRPVLEVHKACDAIYKSDTDQFYEAFQHSMSSPPQDWSSEKIRQVSKHLGELKLLGNGQFVGTIHGLDKITLAVETWVRGLHALLFSQYLPGHRVTSIAPIGTFVDSSSKALQQHEQTQNDRRSMCAKMCLFAYKMNKAHRLVCWGGKIEYICCWAHVRARSPKKIHSWPICFWSLNVPGVVEWTQAQIQESIPWAGMYAVPQTYNHWTPLLCPELEKVDLFNSINLPEDLYEIMPSLNPDAEYFHY